MSSLRKFSLELFPLSGGSDGEENPRGGKTKQKTSGKKRYCLSNAMNFLHT
jgi:hypothetical protein